MISTILAKYFDIMHLFSLTVKMDVDDVNDAAIDPSTSGKSESDKKAPIITGGYKVVASPGTVGSVSVKLHPLVIMNISEHWTRTKVQEGTPQKVYGAIIGKQKGRNIEIMNSFELQIHLIENKTFIDMEYYKMKEEQFKQVFSEMDFLGWYSTGERPEDEDVEVHKQVQTCIGLAL